MVGLLITAYWLSHAMLQLVEDGYHSQGRRFFYFQTQNHAMFRNDMCYNGLLMLHDGSTLTKVLINVHLIITVSIILDTLF